MLCISQLANLNVNFDFNPPTGRRGWEAVPFDSWRYGFEFISLLVRWEWEEPFLVNGFPPASGGPPWGGSWGVPGGGIDKIRKKM